MLATCLTLNSSIPSMVEDNSERQVSSYGRTIDFESYQPITFANHRQIWSIYTL